MEAPAGVNAPLTASFFPVHIDSVDEAILEMDLYIRYGTAEPTLYRARGVAFTERERARLVEQHVQFLYVSMSQHGIYREALNRRLEGLFRSPNRHKNERGRLVRAACVRMVEDVMEFPGNVGAIDAVREVGSILSRFMTEDESAFSYVLDMSAHDYYTTTHMVNVGVGCGMLAAALRPDDHEFRDLVTQGGLLHDLGKRQVPPDVLNREGALSPKDWEQMRRHPTSGYEELLVRGDVHPVILEMTRDHHERLDGSGYPCGRRGNDLSLAARICAVVEVYDAVTTARPYRGPTPPQAALVSMKTEAGTLFDDEVFEAWNGIVMRLLRDDPSRAPVFDPGQASAAAAVFAAHAMPGRIRTTGMRAGEASEFPQRAGGLAGSERREHPRKSCDVMVSAKFERQMKDYGLEEGQVFMVRLKNVSRAGVMLQTPWPLSLNDLLMLELPGGEKGSRRRVRIVRVRRDGQGQWSAGGRFIANEQAESGEAA